MSLTTDDHIKRFNYLNGPIILYSALAAYIGATYGMQAGWTWFSWHPFCMTLGFVLLSSNAILLKKIGGYTNTKMHGIMMVAAAILTGFAWYVIYVAKEMKGKKHLTSTHGQLGAAVMIANIGLAVFGFAALNPDWGFLRTNKTIRFIHKWSGRGIVGLSWVTCVLGFLPMSKGNVLYQGLYAVPLMLLGAVVLL